MFLASCLEAKAKAKDYSGKKKNKAKQNKKKQQTNKENQKPRIHFASLQDLFCIKFRY